VLCVLNASPFHLDKAGEREARMAETCARTGLPLLYAHLVGGQDEVVFDGASFAVDARASGARAPAFERRPADARPRMANRCPGPMAAVPQVEAQAWAALVTGVRDYLGKNGFPGAIIGLSGGIDSALVLAVAVDALGADKVRTVMMPSPYTADISWIDAREMAAAPGCALRRDRHRADVRRLPRQPGGAVCRPARRHDRREPAGPHPRHAADGLVQQERRHRADHRQQERDGHRLLHAVRRHGRRLCRHQGRGQDPGLPPGRMEEPQPNGVPTAAWAR
jgi:hypothetical protein